jgi:hypothetical protein
MPCPTPGAGNFGLDRILRADMYQTLQHTVGVRKPIIVAVPGEGRSGRAGEDEDERRWVRLTCTATETRRLARERR